MNQYQREQAVLNSIERSDPNVTSTNGIQNIINQIRSGGIDRLTWADSFMEMMDNNGNVTMQKFIASFGPPSAGLFNMISNRTPFIRQPDWMAFYDMNAPAPRTDSFRGRPGRMFATRGNRPRVTQGDPYSRGGKRRRKKSTLRAGRKSRRRR
jgi:hypothetical protein